MKCTKCQATGELSEVDVLSSSTTQLEKRVYFDTAGDQHVHNPNITTTRYRCTNGHRFEERSCWQCTCGWKKMDAVVTFLGEATGSSEVKP